MSDEDRDPVAADRSATDKAETPYQPSAATPRAELVASNEGVRPIIPRTVEEAFRLAQAVVKAGLAPDSYDNDPQKILLGIMAAAEVGLPPLRGLSSIAIINKRATIFGDGAVALVQKTGLVERVDSYYEIDGKPIYAPPANAKEPAPSDYPDGYTAIFRIFRKGQKHAYEGRFSVRDAKRAHLWANPKRAPWVQYPQRMLMARARAFALRDGFADALAGLSIREEIEDLPAEPKAVDNERKNELLGPPPAPADEADKLQTEPTREAVSESPAQEESP